MKLSRREFLNSIAALSAGFRRLIESECDGFDAQPEAVAQRRAKAQKSLEVFARTYFPHYVKHGNAELHDYLYQRLPELVAASEGARDAIAAPRGNAKSTIVSQIFVLWCLCTGRKRYPVIVMDAFEQAATMLEAVKAELECNPRLATDYPEASGKGRVWQVGTIITANDCKVQVFGSGKRMRGLRHGPHRPDLVIGDDLENDEQVRSPDQRDKLETWFKRTVLSLGAADDTMDVVVIGTILHYDSLLSRLINNPLWRGKRFQSINQWPDQMAMWDQWEELLLNSDDQGATARKFYEEHKREMDKGARIGWPDGQPLYTLMVKRARDGHQAFDSEQQNDPVSGDDAPFAKCLNFWVDRSASWVFYGACDPSLGKFGASRDPSAIGVGGYNRETGVLDVVEADIRKRLPDRIIEDIIEYHRQYRCIVWAIEVVQFQEFFRTELIKRSAAHGVAVPARAVTPHADKTLRIETLQPHMANGLIRLHPSQHTLLAQFRHFPRADHDDGPDMVQMLWMLAQSGASFAIPQSVSRARARRTFYDR